MTRTRHNDALPFVVILLIYLVFTLIFLLVG